MKVILAQPRGFCAGVVRAIEIVERALQKYGPPVFGAFLLAAVVFTLGRLRMARKALRGRR